MEAVIGYASMEDALRAILDPTEYIVVRGGAVVETIQARTADEAISKMTEEGTLYLKVGDQGGEAN